MPCQVDDDELLSDANAQINQLTQLLCTACTEIQELGSRYKGVYPSNNALRTWWKDHQKRDKVRKEAEQKEREYQARLAIWERKKPRR